MQHVWKFVKHRLAQVVTLMALLVLIQGMGQAQTLAVSPGLTSVVAGDPAATGNNDASIIGTPATYVGPASGLVPANAQSYFQAASDKYGNIYVDEVDGNVVRVIASGNGPIPALPSVTNPQAGYAYTIFGTGIDLNPADANYGNPNPVSSNCTTSIDNYGDGCLATQAAYDGGYGGGITVDGNGNLYIADFDFVRVVYSGNGAIPGISSPQAGYVYLLTGTPDTGSYTGDGGPAINATFDRTNSVAVDSSGNIYVIDSEDNVLRAIYAGGSNNALSDIIPSPVVGNIYTLMGKTGTVANGIPASTAKFQSFGSDAVGIAFDSYGNIYVADRGFNEIRVIYVGGSVPGLANPNLGYVYDFAGSQSSPRINPLFFTPALAASVFVSQPEGLAFDPAGNLYISLSNAEQILKVDPSGNLTVVYGQPTSDISNHNTGISLYPCTTSVDQDNDGCASDASDVSGGNGAPSSVTVDPQGNLYIADTYLFALHELNVSTSSLDFAPGQTQPVILYNTGTAALTLSSFAPSAPFTVVPLSTVPTGITADCSALPTLQPGESCESQIEFPSSDTSAVTGTLTIASNATNATEGSNVVQLTGESAANAALKATTLGFATVPPNSITVGQAQSLSFSLGCITSGPNNCYRGPAFPTGTLTLYSGNTGSGNASLGTLQVNNTNNGGSTYTFNNVTLPPGTNLVYAIYGGDSNYSGSNSGQALIYVNGTTSTIAVTPSASTINVGSSVTLTASVTPNSATGSVTFKTNNGITTLGTANLTGGTATFSTTNLPIGTDSVTAVYSGDNTYNPSTSAPTTVTVNGITTTTSLTASPNPAAAGATVTLMASVAPPTGNTGTPTGSIAFKNGGTTLATVPLANGSATYTTSSLANGPDSITAVYSGDNTYTTSTGSVTVTVSVPAQTSTGVAASSSSIGSGQPVTLTATITAPSGVTTLSGTVTFYDSVNGGAATALGAAVNLNAGATSTQATATLTASSLSFGNNSITAVYSGAELFETSSSAPAIVSVDLAPTTTTLTPSSTSISYGQSVSLTAKVTPQISTTTALTGTVSFSVGTTSLGTATVNNGTATLSGAVLPGGSGTETDTVTATYLDPTNTFASSTGTATVSVGSLPTTTSAVSASNYSPAIGASVTLAATVSSGSSSLTPTGTVNFYANGSTTPLASAQLVSGTATVSNYSFSAAGPQVITATFVGGSGFASSNSTSPVTINVAAQPVNTTTTLQISPSTPTAGQSVLFTATVAAASGTPSGTIEFVIGSSTVTAPVGTNGVATYSTNALTAGSYLAKAIYQGATGYNGSQSAQATLTISPALTATMTTLSLSSSAVQQGANVTFTVQVVSASSSSTITPTGTVTFMSGTQTIAGPVTLNGGTLTYSSTSLGAGSYSVTAVYSGDGNYAGSTSTATALTVGAPTPSFTVSATPSSLTLQTGQSGSAIITLVPTYGYTGTVTLSCGTLPANVTCSFSPATLTADGKNDVVQSTLNITTSNGTAQLREAKPFGSGRSSAVLSAALFFLPAGLLGLGFSDKRKRLGRYLSLAVLVFLGTGLLALSGCGGGNGGSTTDAAKGTSQIVVTAAGSAGSQSQTVNLSITIQ